MATVELPTPVIVTASDLRDERDAAEAQVRAGDAEASAARAGVGEQIYASWVAFREEFFKWESSLSFWETTLALTVAGTPNDWEQARSYRLQAINWRQRFALALGRPLDDPSTDVRATSPTDLSWVKWAAVAVIVLVAAQYVPKLR